jgi:hypothetical protein
MPKQIAFRTPLAAPMEFIIAAALVNDAVEHNIKIVEDAELEVELERGAGAPGDRLRCRWMENRDLIPTTEYEARYGKVSEAAKVFRDQFTPGRRRAPFVIHSKELQSPSLVFNCGQPIPPGAAGTNLNVHVVLDVMTATKTYRSERHGYALPGDLQKSTHDGSWNWIERSASKGVR